MNNNKSADSYTFTTENAVFMGAKRNPNNCKVGLFGVPYDGTTSYRPGARFGR